MSDNTKIEWADATANFWIGCTKVSPACDNCYAERGWDHRKHRVTWGPHGDRSHVKAGPLVCRKVQRGAAAFIAEHGRKPRIFVNSLSDFADNHKSILPEWREAVWLAARECPDVIFMVLTKRPQNLVRYLPADWGIGYPNVWIGTTVENQIEADRRIPDLLATPAAVRFLSCEPQLGPVDLNGWLCEDWERMASIYTDGEGVRRSDISGNACPGIDWVICGGESGANARPMHPDWARSLRDQCAGVGVAFHFKQWGEWAEIGHDEEGPKVIEVRTQRGRDMHSARATGQIGFISKQGQFFATEDDIRARARLMHRIGKKAAGRMLDGVTHDGLPS